MDINKRLEFRSLHKRGVKSILKFLVEEYRVPFWAISADTGVCEKTLKELYAYVGRLSIIEASTHQAIKNLAYRLAESHGGALS